MKKNKVITLFSSLFIVLLISLICMYNNKRNALYEWHDKYKVIAHALGVIDGYTYTNSYEAFYNSYVNGIRVFDADLNKTSDDVYVLRHEWSDNLETAYDSGTIPSYEEFKNSKIYGKYTPMSLIDFLHLMDEHSDIYVTFDAKFEITLAYKIIVEYAKKENLEHVLDRVIVSFYKYDDYDSLKNIYNFKNYAIRHYENDPKDYDELIKFCKQNDIKVVNVKKVYLEQDKNWEKLINNDIKIYAAVINKKETYKKFKNISGCVSDNLSDKDL